MANPTDIGPLDHRVSIVDKQGKPSPEFQRRWNSNRANTALITGTTFGTGAPTATPSGDGQKYFDTSVNPYRAYVSYSGVYAPASPIGGTPSALASDTATVGTATTFMRSDASPAIQKASATQFGLVKVDGLTITSTGGIISSVGGGGSAATFGSGPPSVSSGATPTLDGTPVTTTFSGGTSGTITFSTVNAQRVAVLVIGVEQSGVDIHVTSVTSPHLTWTRRGAGTATGYRGHETAEIWWAPVASIVTSEVVTVTFNTTQDDAAMGLFVVAGASLSSPWDPNVSLPSYAIGTFNSPIGPIAPPVFSTTYAHSLVFAGMFCSAAVDDTSAWTSLFTANNGGGANWGFLSTFYESVSTIQTGATASLTNTNNTIYLRFVDALTGGSGITPTDGSIYFDTTSNPYTEWVYHSGAWNQVSGVQIKSSGTSLGDVTTLNFAGSGVTTTVSGNTATVTIAGGGGGGGGNYVYLGGGTYSGVTEIDFTSLISSSYDNYCIEYYDVVPSVNGTDIGVQLSTDNGTTWISTGYTYYANGYGINTNYSYYIPNTSLSYLMLQRTLSNTPAYSTQGRFEMRGLGGSTYKKVSMSRGVSAKSDGNAYFEEQASLSSTTAAVNALRIVQSGSATISGTFRLYGISP